MTVALDSQILIANSFLKIHSMRNISNFQKNIMQIDSFINKIKKSEEGLQLNRLKRNHIRDPFSFLYANKSSTSKDIIDNIQQLTYRKLSQCRNSVETTKNKAKKLFQASIRKSNLSTRKKRGLSVLGEIISSITDQPSPSEWSHEKILVKDLKTLVTRERNETHQIMTSLELQEKNFEEIIPSINKLTSTIDKTNSDIHLMNLLTIDKLHFEIACNEGKKMAKKLLNEAKSISKICKNALLNKPDEVLFPQKKLISIVQKHRKNIKHSSPVLSNEHEIFQIYEMSAAVTIINSNMIHSLISIPIADYSYKYSFIDYPLLNKTDIETLNVLSKIALKPIDTFTCSKKQRQIRLFSSLDLPKCFRTPTGKIYICSYRTSVVPTSHLSCENFHLPSSLMIELSPTLVLVKTDQKFLTEKCNDNSKEIEIKTTYSILNIPRSCEIHGKNFYIGKFDFNSSESIIVNSTYVAKTFDYPENIEFYDSTRANLEHKNFSQLISNIQGHIKKAKKLDMDAQNDLELLKNDFENDFFKNDYVKWPIFGIIMVTLMICIALATMKIVNLCKKCKTELPNASNETIISSNQN